MWSLISLGAFYSGVTLTVTNTSGERVPTLILLLCHTHIHVSNTNAVSGAYNLNKQEVIQGPRLIALFLGWVECINDCGVHKPIHLVRERPLKFYSGVTITNISGERERALT